MPYILSKSLCKVSIPMSSNVLIISVLISSGPIALFNFVSLKENSTSLFIIAGPDSGATILNGVLVLSGSPYNSSMYFSISPRFHFLPRVFHLILISNIQIWKLI